VSELEALVAKLGAKAGISSRNSSRPPSTDPPWARESKKSKDGEKRKRGGQHGHPKSQRATRPPEEVDCVEDVFPQTCGGCGEALHGRDQHPRRHQVTEIPPISTWLTEYRLHALTCGVCGDVSRARLPEGVPQGAFGPRLEATIALLTGHYRVSRRSTQELLEELFGLSISLGAISKIEGRVGNALAPMHAEALDRVRGAKTKHADETSWRQAGEKFWMWVAKTDEAVAFLIRDNRSGEVARELLGEDLVGTLISDRWSGYTWVDLGQRQVCWAHLFRDFRKMAESGGKESKRIGEDLTLLGGALFVWLYKYRDGEIPRSQWRKRADDFRKEMKKLLDEGSKLDEWRAPGLCRGILEVESAMWTFVRNECVEPTNNDAERAIRRAVIWRKTSLGTQSQRGSLYAERILTCAATLRLQGRSVFEFLHQVCSAVLQCSAPVSLFP
jgi:transposase